MNHALNYIVGLLHFPLDDTTLIYFLQLIFHVHLSHISVLCTASLDVPFHIALMYFVYLVVMT